MTPPPPRKSRKKTGIPKKLLDFFKSRKGEEYHTKIVAGIIGEDYDATRRALNRMEKELPELNSTRMGRDTFWKYEGVTQEIPDVVELERQLGDIINMQTASVPELHNIHLYLKKETWDNKDVPLPASLRDFFNPIHPNSLYQKVMWYSDHWKEIRGGIMDVRYYKGRRIVFQAYGTGKANITIGASDKPITIPEWFEFDAWLSGTLDMLCGVTMEDLKDVITVSWEWANDAVPYERIDSSGKFAITAKVFDDAMARIYTKHFSDGSVKVRTEQIIEDEVSYPEWLMNSSALFAGGVNSQFLIRNHFENQKTLERIMNHLEKRDNNIQFNQENNKKLAREIEETNERLRKALKKLGIE